MLFSPFVNSFARQKRPFRAGGRIFLSGGKAGGRIFLSGGKTSGHIFLLGGKTGGTFFFQDENPTRPA